MTIETKYNIGQEVYAIYDNAIHKFKICSIDISIEEGFDGQYVLPIRQETKYHDFGKKHTFLERNLYATKEDIISSL